MINTSTTGESGDPTTNVSSNASGFITRNSNNLYRNVRARTGLEPVEFYFISNRLMNKKKKS